MIMINRMSFNSQTGKMSFSKAGVVINLKYFKKAKFGDMVNNLNAALSKSPFSVLNYAPRPFRLRAKRNLRPELLGTWAQ